MAISDTINLFLKELQPSESKLIAVSKTYPKEAIEEAYAAGQKRFGENKVQELVTKYEVLPKDIEWHLIGHLQTNKVKYIAPFVSLIHSIDSEKLLKEVNKEATKNNRVIEVLLQAYIAQEDTKFGLDFEEIETIFKSEYLPTLTNVKIVGFMGMASNTEDKEQVRQEFKSLKSFLEKCKQSYKADNIELKELSMGMSGDFTIAMEEGSTMVRVGSAIFGSRQY